ncbi:hypothetical protein CcCBS67573_g08474 [Chytriomyces confervae]|uniref:Vacuolar protein sorting-associated protein 35 n=1 Tax=Chytriomyces confervae TaxID=246404 RepID=A0A507ELE8_9FUNG|nr:hypothetical protein CcCBS67573_g08474 [Chytriomyces confervae]
MASAQGQSLTQSQTQTQQKMLDEALAVVKAQCLQMRRCLDNNRLMDALKHCSAMLAELKTATLAPKGYYELYMAIFDQLRHLALYLYESHMSARHHLSDLYELVQYAGSIVPRLYLMITVGSVFMRVSREIRAAQPQPQPPQIPPVSLKGKEAVREPATSPSQPVDASSLANQKPLNPIHDVPPLKELLKDMLDMALGVQHPIRGLFLRYYLTSMCRDYMPDGDMDSPFGSRLDSIQFLLQNFVEMNKLWVRLQYVGHSRERPQRELERRELKLLVGSNLLRLSQIEGLNVESFSQIILPSIMSEVVNCRDVMAQEYLMEVVIQVFPDDFHLHTLDLFLSATSQLNRNVNVKATVMSLVNRFTAFARRAREEHSVKVKAAAARGEKLEPISGIPGEIRVFEIFWEQVRPEFELHDVIALLSSLVELSTGCYPTRYDYVDLILGYAKDRVMDVVVNKQPAMSNPETSAALLNLLLTTVNAYKSNPLVYMSFPSSSRNFGLVTVLTPQQPERINLGPPSEHRILPETPKPSVSSSICGNFTDLLRLQSFSTRKRVARAFAANCAAASNTLTAFKPVAPQAENGSTTITAATNSGGGGAKRFRIDSLEAVEAVFAEICEVIVRDEVDGGLAGPRVVRIDDGSTSPERIGTISDGLTGKVDVVDLDSVVGECGAVARLVLLVGSGGTGNPDDDLQLFSLTKKLLKESGDVRLKFSIPPLVFSCVGLARSYLAFTGISDAAIIQRLNSLFQFMNESIHMLADAKQPRHGSEPESIARLRNTANGGGGGLPTSPDLLMKLHLTVAQSAHECRAQESCYEALVNAITTFEERLTESKAQPAALHSLIATLSLVASGLSYENYVTLVGRVIVHCGRLLKKTDQCRSLLVAGHLYWGVERKTAVLGVVDHPVSEDAMASSRSAAAAASAAAASSKRSKLSGLLGEEAGEEAGSGGDASVGDLGGKAYRDGKKVLECLQKSLKVADSVLEVSVNTELFVEIFEQYVWFYENGNEWINVSYLNSLIELIQSNVVTTASVVSGESAGVPQRVVRRFGNVITRLKALKDEEEEERRERGLDVNTGGIIGGFGGASVSGGRWTQLELH